MTVIECLQKVRSVCPYGETCGGGEYKEGSDCDKFAESLQNKKAHKPGVGLITREQVDKMRGDWKFVGSDRWNDTYECQQCGCLNMDDPNFCPTCGTPMKDEAVDILWKRLEAMQDEAETD